MADIKVRNDGPYGVSGEIRLVDASGSEFTKNETFLLCRCGHSADKPFCDGSHGREGFESQFATE